MTVVAWFLTMISVAIATNGILLVHKVDIPIVAKVAVYIGCLSTIAVAIYFYPIL